MRKWIGMAAALLMGLAACAGEYDQGRLAFSSRAGDSSSPTDDGASNDVSADAGDAGGSDVAMVDGGDVSVDGDVGDSGGSDAEDVTPPTDRPRPTDVGPADAEDVADVIDGGDASIDDAGEDVPVDTARPDVVPPRDVTPPVDVPPACAGGCDDGNPCTMDACDMGRCVHASFSAGTMCPVGMGFCNGATTSPVCVACVIDGNCAAGQHCDTTSNRCVTTVVDAGADAASDVVDAGTPDTGSDAGTDVPSDIPADIMDAGLSDTGVDAGPDASDTGVDAGPPVPRIRLPFTLSVPASSSTQITGYYARVVDVRFAPGAAGYFVTPVVGAGTGLLDSWRNAAESCLVTVTSGPLTCAEMNVRALLPAGAPWLSSYAIQAQIFNFGTSLCTSDPVTCRGCWDTSGFPRVWRCLREPPTTDSLPRCVAGGTLPAQALVETVNPGSTTMFSVFQFTPVLVEGVRQAPCIPTTTP